MSNQTEIKNIDDLVSHLRKETGDPEGNFDRALMASEWKYKYIWYFKFRKKNKKGEWMKKIYEKGVVMNYNPFTGEKLD